MSGDVAAWVPVATALAGLGGALGTQWLSHHFSVVREKQASETKKAAERVYIGCQLMLLIVDYREQCREYSNSQAKENKTIPRPPVPNFNSVKGEWSVLSATLQLRINRLAFRRLRNEEELSTVFEHFGFEDYCDRASLLYEKVVDECDLIIEELMASCDLPSPWDVDN